MAGSVEHNSRNLDGEPRGFGWQNYVSAEAAVASVMRTRRPYGAAGR
jgi:hypothetical protein